MNALSRRLRFLPEAALFGPSYAIVNWLIRSPRPLDEEWVWNYCTRKFSPLEDAVRMNYPPQWLRRFWLSWFLKRSHESGIAEHYDVSNAFYELFLDRRYMLYTCADFITGRETLEEAQANKVQFLLDLIDPHPGERILELGCGWGGMLQEIYDRTGDRENLFGYTLSKEQVEFNRQRRGLQVEYRNFITTDYPTEYFDKIYNIGSWEHVRRDDLRPTLAKLYGALKPGGKLISHYFCGLERGVPTAALTAQIFFPGSAKPPYPVQLRWAQEAGFRVMHQSLHDTYRDTLRHWFERLVANREEAIRLVGVETYNRYVLFFPCSWKYFDDVQAVVWRSILQKPPISVPLAKHSSDRSRAGALRGESQGVLAGDA